MEAEVWVVDGLRTEARSGTGFNVNMDSPKEVGGQGTGFSPMEATLMAWGGCSLADVTSILKKKRVSFTDLRVKVHADRRKEHPRVFEDALLEYIVEAEGDHAQGFHKAIRLSLGRYCPVATMVASVGTKIRVVATYNGESIELLEPYEIMCTDTRPYVKD